MGQYYSRSSLVERKEISLGLPLGKSVRSIGRQLGRSALTVSGEIRRDVRKLLAYRAECRAALGVARIAVK